MNWIAVKYFPLDQDLTPLSRFLHRRRVEHRITENEGQQCLAVMDETLVPGLQDFLQQLADGRAQLPSEEEEQLEGYGTESSFLTQALHTPVVLWLILLSGLGWLLIATDIGRLFVHYVSFQDFTTTGFVPLSTSLAQGEVWRLLTPIFLHFGVFHFLFNSLWMWDLGRRLEVLQGRWAFVAFVVITGVASNLTQYGWSGESTFGGMSGVVYALVGFIAVRQRLCPHPIIAVPPAIIGFMLFWLVLCMTGIVDYFIAGSVANAAHLGGLIAGALYALATRRFFRR